MFRKKEDRQPLKFHDFWEMDHHHVSSAYQKLWKRIEQSSLLILPRPSTNWWKMTALATFVALLIVGGLYWFTLVHPVQQPIEIMYATDRVTQIVLSDRTKVWMSAQSQLRYQKMFIGKTRDVVLDGEAYFEVAHNSEQPFRVLTGGQIVEVLGTSFNVRAYTDAHDVKIALVEGSVKVTDEKSGEAVILKPAQEATIVKSDGLIVVSDIDLEMMMSWKTGRYVFHNLTFEEIAKMLEKGFNVTIHIENQELKRKLYTMRFENGETLEEILNLIQINAKYSYQYKNGIVIIK